MVREGGRRNGRCVHLLLLEPESALLLLEDDGIGDGAERAEEEAAEERGGHLAVVRRVQRLVSVLEEGRRRKENREKKRWKGIQVVRSKRMSSCVRSHGQRKSRRRWAHRPAAPTAHNASSFESRSHRTLASNRSVDHRCTIRCVLVRRCSVRVCRCHVVRSLVGRAAAPLVAVCVRALVH